MNYQLVKEDCMSNEPVSKIQVKNALKKIAPSLGEHPIVLEGLAKQVCEEIARGHDFEIGIANVAPMLLDLEAKFRATR